MSTRKSIDDATPEDWNSLRKPITHRKIMSNRLDKIIEEDFLDDKKFDDVSKPAHYNNGSMECIDAIRGMLSHEEYIGYLRGNSLKYRWRFRYKGKPVEDLRKARWYEDRLLNYELEHPSEQLR
tara:strand:- start:2306 stop:2677 length:372 start_codon:yes stop_codon:yes gene_type:complete